MFFWRIAGLAEELVLGQQFEPGPERPAAIRLERSGERLAVGQALDRRRLVHGQGDALRLGRYLQLIAEFVAQRSGERVREHGLDLGRGQDRCEGVVEEYVGAIVFALQKAAGGSDGGSDLRPRAGV